MRLALTYPTGAVARELVEATLAMIGGQQQDLEGGHDLAELHSLKTGALFNASIMCGIWAAGLPVDAPRRGGLPAAGSGGVVTSLARVAR